MAFTALTTGEITSGQPVSSTTQGKIKTNFDDHETRIGSIESGSSVAYPPLIMRVNGSYRTKTAILKTTCNFNLMVSGLRLIIDHAGTLGTTQVDVKFKRGAGAWTSILTTLPSVSYTSGDDAVSTNAVLNPTYSTLQGGDLIRLDVVSVQTSSMSFMVRIDYSKV
jgi:hypothetical protein